MTDIRAYILSFLEKTGITSLQAAKCLGMTRQQFSYKLFHGSLRAGEFIDLLHGLGYTFEVKPTGGDVAVITDSMIVLSDYVILSKSDSERLYVSKNGEYMLVGENGVKFPKSEEAATFIEKNGACPQ